MNDSYTLLQNLVNATLAQPPAANNCRIARTRYIASKNKHREACKRAEATGTRYPDKMHAAGLTLRDAYIATIDASTAHADALPAALAHIRGTEAAIFAPTDERFGDEA